MEERVRYSDVNLVVHYFSFIEEKLYMHLLEMCVKQVMLYYCCISLVLPFRMVSTAMPASVLLGLVAAGVKPTSMQTCVRIVNKVRLTTTKQRRQDGNLTVKIMNTNYRSTLLMQF